MPLFGYRNKYESLPRSSQDFTTQPPVNRIVRSPARSRRWITTRCLKLVYRGTRSLFRYKRAIARTVLVLFLLYLAYVPLLAPSYRHKPKHYSGTNLHQERVFIAANIIDANLIRGAWGKALLGLVDIIGRDNVFVSIYENDSPAETRLALHNLTSQLTCSHSIVSGHISLDSFPTVQVLPNDPRVKRIAYLSKVRNHALDLLINHKTGSQRPSNMEFDRLLFINDVVFDPKDAANLLFATNAKDNQSKAVYDAACAMDFINPLKFYDRYALRDSDGYESGVPVYPWFVKAGGADSYKAVLAHFDAVPVKSCWGGMAAFDAKYFLANKQSTESPLRFRSDPDIFFDSSECCLIHADLSELIRRRNTSQTAQIYVNPYVRVAYDSGTFAWLNLARQFEGLSLIPHRVISFFLRQPWQSQRRSQIPGEKVLQHQWVYTGPGTNSEMLATLPSSSYSARDISKFGYWQQIHTVATPGGFCGYNSLSVMKTKRQQGECMWERVFPPPLLPSL